MRTKIVYIGDQIMDAGVNRSELQKWYAIIALGYMKQFAICRFDTVNREHFETAWRIHFAKTIKQDFVTHENEISILADAIKLSEKIIHEDIKPQLLKQINYIENMLNNKKEKK